MHALSTHAAYQRKTGLRAESLQAQDHRRDSFALEENQYLNNGQLYQPSNYYPAGQPPPPQAVNSFLSNPVSEMEARHRMLEAEYRSYMQAGYRGRPKSRTPEPLKGDISRRRKEVLQEPEDSIYFPFGRPGGGAPLRDPKTRFLEDTSFPAPSKDRLHRPDQSPPKVTQTIISQDRENKARQQEEMRRLLDEQMDQRRKRADEEKRARLAEEQVEEERIARQRREMEEEYRRELRSREGIHDTQAASPSPKPLRQPQAPPANLLPPPVVKYPREPIPYDREPPKYQREVSDDSRDEKRSRENRPQYVGNSLANEDRLQKLRDEMTGRQQTLQDLISKLKEESAGLSIEKHDAMREFELMREDLRAKKAQSEPLQQYRPPPAQHYVTGPWKEPARHRLQQETRFVPISKAGLSVVSGGDRVASFSTVSQRTPSYQALPSDLSHSYTDIASPEVSHQLSKLDSILDYCKGLELPNAPIEVQEEDNMG